MTEDGLHTKLNDLITEINTDFGDSRAELIRQDKDTKRMSIRINGTDGRLGIHWTTSGIDLTLSGQSSNAQMYPFMREICRAKHDGYKHKHRNEEPYWHIDDFSLVRLAAYCFATARG